MDWKLILIVTAAVGTLVALKRLSLVSASVARKFLAQGALLVDVRTAGEFHGDHLPNALNIPLDKLRESLPRRVPDKNQVLLLHCLSGTRSGIAKRQLRDLGYPNAFNLGSYGRAKRIVTVAPRL
jgi:phage shock protein E